MNILNIILIVYLLLCLLCHIVDFFETVGKDRRKAFRALFGSAVCLLIAKQLFALYWLLK